MHKMLIMGLLLGQVMCAAHVRFAENPNQQRRLFNKDMHRCFEELEKIVEFRECMATDVVDMKNIDFEYEVSKFRQQFKHILSLYDADTQHIVATYNRCIQLPSESDWKKLTKFVEHYQEHKDKMHAAYVAVHTRHLNRQKQKNSSVVV